MSKSTNGGPSPPTDPKIRRSRQMPQMKPSDPYISNEPMAVHSRGRLYTSRRQRAALGCDDTEQGRGTEVAVKIDVVDRDTDWGIHINTAVFEAAIVTDGAIRIPADARERLGVQQGDTVRVTITKIK